MSSKAVLYIILTFSVILFLGDAPQPPITILAPVFPDSSAYDQGQLFLLSCVKNSTSEILVSTQWDSEKMIDISTKANKDNLPKEVYKMFPPRSAIEMISTSYLFYSGWSKPDSVNFSYADTMTARFFWQLPQFANILNQAQSINASYVIIHLRGWKDTAYTSTHPDPADSKNQLYRIPVQLIPGANKIYFSVNSVKSDAAESFVRYLSQPRSARSNEWSFHGSELSAGCAKCHTELPGETNAGGERDKCGLCHNEIAGGVMKHGPAAETKECSTCHERSPEKNTEDVPKGVPGVCFECHTEKKEEVENSPVPHPVAQECVICHSPHATDQPKFLKNDVFHLCAGCHENYLVNHPVDKHPMRFSKLDKKSTEEISCVSCHQPHGSPNAALLRVSGGSMAVCMQCHQK